MWPAAVWWAIGDCSGISMLPTVSARSCTTMITCRVPVQPAEHTSKLRVGPGGRSGVGGCGCCVRSIAGSGLAALTLLVCRVHVRRDEERDNVGARRLGMQELRSLLSRNWTAWDMLSPANRERCCCCCFLCCCWSHAFTLLLHLVRPTWCTFRGARAARPFTQQFLLLHRSYGLQPIPCSHCSSLFVQL